MKVGFGNILLLSWVLLTDCCALSYEKARHVSLPIDFAIRAVRPIGWLHAVTSFCARYFVYHSLSDATIVDLSRKHVLFTIIVSGVRATHRFTVSLADII